MILSTDKDKYPDGTISVDMADVDNSTHASCEHDHFLCANDECVAASYMCDGNDDCGDNSDESTICSGDSQWLVIIKKEDILLSSNVVSNFSSNFFICISI